MYSSNAVMKEKSIKIVQYASQMMLGFYAPTLSPQQREKFSTALFMCSTCRKSIRFLKFITMFREAVEKYNLKKKIDVEGALEVLEPFFTSWYFIGDNVVLLERLQVIRKAPNFFVHLLNWGDFMMDLSSMAHKSIKIRRCARRRAEVLHRLSKSLSS